MTSQALQLLTANQAKLQQLVPAKAVDYTVVDIIRQAGEELRNNKKLRDCAPESIATAVRQAVQLGLNISGSLRQAALIPYGKECKLDFQYQGLMELARRSSLYKQMSAHVVYEGDDFRAWNDVDGQHYEHKLSFSSRSDERIVGVYAIAVTHQDELYLEMMSKDEIDDLEQKTRKGNFMSPAWKNFYGEMARKTVIKRLIKWIPKTQELNHAITIDNENNSQLPGTAPKPAPKPQPQIEAEIVEPQSLEYLDSHPEWDKLNTLIEEYDLHNHIKERFGTTASHLPIAAFETLDAFVNEEANCIEGEASLAEENNNYSELV